MEIQFKMTVDPSNPATSALLMQLLQNQPQQINSGAPQQAQEPTPQPVINLSVTPSTKAEKPKPEKVKPAVIEQLAEKKEAIEETLAEIKQEATSEPTDKPSMDVVGDLYKGAWPVVDGVTLEAVFLRKLAVDKAKNNRAQVFDAIKAAGAANLTAVLVSRFEQLYNAIKDLP